MSFKKPFQAVPIKLGESYRRKRDAEIAKDRHSAILKRVKIAIVGLLLGGAIGLLILN